MYKVHDKELEAVQRLPASGRYQYFLGKVTDWQELWSVADDRGWVLMADEAGTELVPVWPAERFASLCCRDQWKDHRAKAIPLAAWLEKWIPGMTADGRKVAVFPLPNDRGIIRSAEELREDIEDALGAYDGGD